MNIKIKTLQKITSIVEGLIIPITLLLTTPIVSMINQNKLYSGLFSIVLIYTVMTIFELIFFSFIVCPVITNNIHNLLKSYVSKTKQQIDFDPNPMTIANVLNEREYRLINNFNLDNYLIITILIVFLICLLFYLYVKIGIIEETENTEGTGRGWSPGITPISSDTSNTSRSRSDSRSSSQLVQDDNERINSQNSNNSVLVRGSIKKIYLKHAIRCAVSTITCLIVYQIFFYNYGLSFKYVGTENELIVLFIKSVIN